MKYLTPLELYQQSLKSTGPLMALAVGKTQLGLSMSDDTKTDVPHRSCTTLPTPKRQLSALHSLIARCSVSGLVIGYPFKMKEKFPAVGLEAKNFVYALNEHKDFEGMKYTLWDETSTTKMQFHIEKELSKPFKFIPMSHDAIKDEYASFEILKEYFYFIRQRHVQLYFDILNESKIIEDKKNKKQLPGKSS